MSLNLTVSLGELVQLVALVVAFVGILLRLDRRLTFVEARLEPLWSWYCRYLVDQAAEKQKEL